MNTIMTASQCRETAFPKGWGLRREDEQVDETPSTARETAFPKGWGLRLDEQEPGEEPDGRDAKPLSPRDGD